MRTFTNEELKVILEKHLKYRKNEDGGERANLRGSDLSYSDLSYSDLSYSDLSYSDLSYSDLSYSDLSYSDLSYSDLRGSDLRGSDLRGSDLSYSDLDFSYLSFSCKSLSAKFDQKHVIQILYHAAMPTQNDVLELDDDIKDLLNSDLFKAVANKFHRVEECGEFKGCKSEARRRGRLI